MSLFKHIKHTFPSSHPFVASRTYRTISTGALLVVGIPIIFSSPLAYELFAGLTLTRFVFLALTAEYYLQKSRKKVCSIMPEKGTKTPFLRYICACSPRLRMPHRVNTAYAKV